MNRFPYMVGIDPGVTTGIAIKKDGEFIGISSASIMVAMQHVLNLKEVADSEGKALCLRFEDARLRTYFGSTDREVLQGAGSIKRDCSIWQEFCELHQIPFLPIRPTKGSTKWTAEYFAKVTGWAGRTNEHARDAALLII